MARPKNEINLICANALCRKPFKSNEGAVHLARTNRHFCCRSCKNTTHGLAGTPRHKMWEGARKRSRENGVVFSLTVHDFPVIPMKCPILGIILCPNDKVGPSDTSPSLDRLDPKMGYIAGNVRVISNRANRLRSDATTHELKLLAADSEAIDQVGIKPE